MTIRAHDIVQLIDREPSQLILVRWDRTILPGGRYTVELVSDDGKWLRLKGDPYPSNEGRPTVIPWPAEQFTTIYRSPDDQDALQPAYQAFCASAYGHEGSWDLLPEYFKRAWRAAYMVAFERGKDAGRYE